MVGFAILGGGILLAAFWWYAKRREMLLARAYTYLVILKRPGSTVESSNWVTHSIDMYGARQIRKAIREHVDEVYSGSRAALIAEARAQGFLG